MNSEKSKRKMNIETGICHKNILICPLYESSGFEWHVFMITIMQLWVKRMSTPLLTMGGRPVLFSPEYAVALNLINLIVFTDYWNTRCSFDNHILSRGKVVGLWPDQENINLNWVLKGYFTSLMAKSEQKLLFALDKYLFNLLRCSLNKFKHITSFIPVARSAIFVITGRNFFRN